MARSGLTGERRLVSSALALMIGALVAPTLANAQTPEARAAHPAPPPRGAAAPPAPPAPPPPISAGGDMGPIGPVTPASVEIVPIPNELLHAEAGGLTSEQVGERAGKTSYSAKVAEEQLRGAAALVDSALAGFLPRLTGVAKYTRYNSFTPPSLLAGPPTSIATNQPPPPAGTVVAADPTQLVAYNTPNFTFPLFLNNYFLQATITIPISDYFLRINQSYTQATRSEDAARFDVATARAASTSDGRVAYYSWMRARGGLIVSLQALNDQRTHLSDARSQFTVGNASKADVLRAETSVAAAELAVERARNLMDLTEKQIRVAMHAPPTEKFSPGEGLDSPPAPFQGNVAQLTEEALGQRLEIKSADANAEVARKQAEVAHAGRYPVVSAFGDATYANPNPRYFSLEAKWFPTWDVGVQASWSPNDIATAGAQGAEAEHRALAIDAQKQITRDGIEIEVMQSYQSVHESDVALESTRRELASATEAYRVAHELFNNGRATSTTLTDAETDLTRARLEALNASVDAHVARVRLDHAVGRDTRAATP